MCVIMERQGKYVLMHCSAFSGKGNPEIVK